MAICNLAATAQDTLNIDTLLIFDGRTRGPLSKAVPLPALMQKPCNRPLSIVWKTSSIIFPGWICAAVETWAYKEI